MKTSHLSFVEFECDLMGHGFISFNGDRQTYSFPLKQNGGQCESPLYFLKNGYTLVF